MDPHHLHRGPRRWAAPRPVLMGSMLAPRLLSGLQPTGLLSLRSAVSEVWTRSREPIPHA